MANTEWLTRDDIDAVLETLSADDLIEATAGSVGGKVNGSKLAGDAYNNAALRAGQVGKDEKATARIRASDFTYLAQRIGEVMNVESPLSEGTVALLDSAATGE